MTMNHLTRARVALRTTFVVVFATLLLAVLFPVALQAEETPVTAAGPTGSVTLLLGDGSGNPETDMVGGTVAIYRVALVGQDPSRFDVSLGQFAGFDGTPVKLEQLVNMDTQELDAVNKDVSSSLEEYATTQRLEPYAITSIVDGAAVFNDLPLGLFLFVQPDPSEGGRTMNAFILSVPGEEGELDVVAQPKSGIEGPIKEDEPTPIPVNPTPSDQPTPATPSSQAPSGQAETAEKSIGVRIPTMGDMGVQVTNYVLLGLLCVAIGLALRPRNKRGTGA